MGDSLLVLAEQLRHPNGQSDLAGHGLGQRNLLFAPSSGCVAVEREDSDQRNGKNGARAEAQKHVTTSERSILELRRRPDILDRHGPAALHREVRNGQTPPGLHRRQAGALPLRSRNLTVRAEPDQASVDAQGKAGLLHCHAQQLVDVQLGANACRDPGDEALAIERLGQTGRRAGAIEREGRIAGDLLQHAELLARECPVPRNRAGN